MIHFLYSCFFFSGSTVASFVEFVHSLGMFDSIWVRDRRMCLRSRLFFTKAFSGLKLFNPVKFCFVLLYLLLVKFNESIDIFLQSVFFLKAMSVLKSLSGVILALGYLGHIEEQIGQQCTGTVPQVHKRYMDNVVGIACCSRVELEDYIAFVSNFHPALQFTHTISETELPFPGYQSPHFW